MHTISIIVPIYNVEKYLSRCINSILNQSFTDFELILIDDGSPDRCGEICEEYAMKDNRITVIHQNNKGLSVARNIGLDNATGEYIVFVDSDDYIHPEMLEKLYDKIIEDNAEIAICEVLELKENGELLNCKHTIKEGLIGKNETMSFLLNGVFEFGVVWNKIYSHSLWKDVRFPQGKWYEDTFVIHEILYKSIAITQVPEALYYYIHREGSITNMQYSIHTLDDIEGYYRRILFFEEKGLQKILINTQCRIFNNYFYVRKNIQINSKEDKKRYHEIKKMVRYYVKKYGKWINKKELFSFEMPQLFHFLQRIKHALLP